MSIPVPNFNTLWEKPYSIYTCEFWNFTICFWWSQRKYSSLQPANKNCVTTVNLVATGLLTICAKKETIIVDQISKGASFITHSSKATLIFAILQVYVKNESTILCIMHSKIKIWHALLIKNNREQLNITHNNTSEV